MFQGIKCIVQGADHIARNKICQDAADFIVGEHYAAAIVADGHGSEKYIRSEVGSKKAVQAAIDTISAYMEDYFRFKAAINKNSDYILTKMEEQFLARWSQYIEDYHAQNPLSEAEKDILKKEKAESRDKYSYYGTTVLIAVMAENFCYGMLVGDGGFVVVESGGKVKIPIEDKNSYANYVSSICSRNAISAFQGFYEECQPLSICVSTDGLIKSFDSEEDFKEYHVILTTMLSNIENCQARLEKNLNKRTRDGSGDDISIAAVFDPLMISSQKKILEDYIKEGQRLKKQRQKREMLEHSQKQAELQLEKISEELKKCDMQDKERKSFKAGSGQGKCTEAHPSGTKTRADNIRQHPRKQRVSPENAAKNPQVQQLQQGRYMAQNLSVQQPQQGGYMMQNPAVQSPQQNGSIVQNPVQQPQQGGYMVQQLQQGGYMVQQPQQSPYMIQNPPIRQQPQQDRYMTQNPVQQPQQAGYMMQQPQQGGYMVQPPQQSQYVMQNQPIQQQPQQGRYMTQNPVQQPQQGGYMVQQPQQNGSMVQNEPAVAKTIGANIENVVKTGTAIIADKSAEIFKKLSDNNSGSPSK